MLSRRVKNQIYRMITGFFLLPLGVIGLIYNENKAVHQSPIFQGYHSELVYWIIRLIGFLFITFCMYRIVSAVKLFMMKIPLTYQEISAGIYITAFLSGLLITLISVSIIWVYHRPLIALILFGVGIVLMVLMIIRRGQQKKLEKSHLPSVKPQQSKDV